MLPDQTITATPAEEEETIDLRQYLGLIRQWWWLFVLATLLAGGAGYLLSRQMTPIYSASTTLLINEAASGKTTDYNSVITSERLATTYAQMITKRPALEQVIAWLGTDMTPEALSKMITAAPVRDTQLIQITVESADPGLSALVANSLVTVFSQQLQDTQASRFAASKESLQKQITDMENQVNQARADMVAAKDADESSRLEARLNQYEQIYANLVMSYEQVRVTEAQSSSSVTQIERAVIPTSPVKPKVLQNALLAAVVGLMLSVGGVFAYDALDDTVKDPEEIRRKLKLPVMASIARYPEPEDGQLITRAQPRSPIAESFRALRTNVQYASVDRPLRTLLVTSPAPADGKTTTIANLAAVLAQGGKQVTLIDADLHRPRVHAIFHTELQPGLSGLFLLPTLSLNGSHQVTNQERLKVISAGKLPPNPSELLGSNKMREIIAAVLEQSDMLLLDTPPVLSVTDAVVLAPMVDGVLIVIKPGVTKMTALKTAVEQLHYVGANIVGFVVNGIDDHSSRYGYYYRSYYNEQYKYYGGIAKRSNGKKSKKAQEKYNDPESV